VQITTLSRGALSNAGIRRGFIITHISNNPVRKPGDIAGIIEEESGGVLVEGVYPDGRRAYYGVAID